jgi:hypothetical protein
MMPTTATISPMERHIRLPVMKLPGIRFNPYPANTPPMTTAITPMVTRAMRPKLLFTLPNLPLTTSRSRPRANDIGKGGDEQQRTGSGIEPQCVHPVIRNLSSCTFARDGAAMAGFDRKTIARRWADQVKSGSGAES